MEILIIEDEIRIARRIEKITLEFFQDNVTTLKLCDSLYDAIHIIENQNFDLVLLDLNLNGKDGFDFLKTAVAQSFHTIIISAYLEKAILAFEFGVLDFVSKPFNRERLFQAFERISQREEPPLPHLKFLAIKKRNRIQLIDLKSVLYIKGAGTYTEIVQKDGTSEIHCKTLEKLGQILPDRFVRIHKSYIVDMTEAQDIIIQPGSKYFLQLKEGTNFPIGRTRYKSLKKKWFSL